MKKIAVRLMRWDKSNVFMVDENTGVVLERLYPIDKARNASAARRPIQETTPEANASESGIAPLLRQQMATYAATGMPPAYLEKKDEEKS